VDVLVIVPHDGKAMGRAVDVAAENGVPVISYDRLITNTGKLDAYISFDNVRVGEMQAKFLEEKIPPGGKLRIVRIYGSPTDNNARLFKKGQDQILEPLIQAGKIEVVHEDWAADWKPENAKKIVNAAITRTPQGFDAVLASNDGTAGGAVQALLEEGLAGKVVVTGQDAELPALQRIVAGTQAMTIYKPIKNLAREAAALAVKLAGGKPVVLTAEVADGDRQIPSLLLDVTTVTKDNLEATVIQDGFHTRESVYGK
jgi:D-xylose transport system substrate-binding protein